MESKRRLYIIMYPLIELIRALFNDVVSTLDYTATNDSMINELLQKVLCLNATERMDECLHSEKSVLYSHRTPPEHK
jgi:hypothetical protein